MFKSAGAIPKPELGSFWEALKHGDVVTFGVPSPQPEYPGAINGHGPNIGA